MLATPRRMAIPLAAERASIRRRRATRRHAAPLGASPRRRRISLTCDSASFAFQRRETLTYSFAQDSVKDTQPDFVSEKSRNGCYNAICTLRGKSCLVMVGAVGPFPETIRDFFYQ